MKRNVKVIIEPLTTLLILIIIFSLDENHIEQDYKRKPANFSP